MVTTEAARANCLFMRSTLTLWARLAFVIVTILGAAFARYGAADAVHLGPASEAGLRVGVDQVARGVAGADPLDKPSTISRGPDTSLVASSGDLGVTIGMIRPDAPAAGQPAAFPFFTIWRRPTTDAPWRYIAE